MRRRSSISAYTPSNTDPKVLDRIFVQRERLLDKIVERLARSMTSRDKHHVLLIGPRGSGKTHMVTLCHERLRNRSELDDAMRIAWLGEDDIFTGLIDIALEIANQLAEQYPDEFSGDYRTPVRSLPPDEAAESILNTIIERLGDRNIVLIMENLDRAFSGLGDLGQKKWRAFLQENARIATLATSQQLFESIKSRDEAFFGFFSIHHLNPLSVEDARALIRKISIEQNNEALVKFLDSPEGRYRIRSIHHLAGGNHRMYVLLSEFLTKDSLDDLVEAFETLAEDLTPYFQERVRALSPQQARIVQALCNATGAMTVKAIAEDTFIPERNCSRQLGELKQRSYVQSQKRGKESYYEMAEPLMRLCLEVKNQRGRPLRLVAMFLRAWFPTSKLRRPSDPTSTKVTRGDEYIASAMETDIGFHKAVKSALSSEISEHMRKGDLNEVLELANELNYADPTSGAMITATVSFQKQDYELCISECSKVIMSSEASEDTRATATITRGVAYGREGNIEAELADYSAVIAMSDAPMEQKAHAHLYRGLTYGQHDAFERAEADFSAVLAMDHAATEDKAVALLYRGIAHGRCGDTEKELADYSLLIATDGAPAEHKAIALLNRGVTYGQQGEIDKELADYSELIASEDAPAEHKAAALFYRGATYAQQGDDERVLVDYAALLAMENVPVEHKIMAINYRAVTLRLQGNIEQAMAEYSLVIAMKDAPAAQRASALVKRGAASAQLNDLEQAIADYSEVIETHDAPAAERARALLYRAVIREMQGDDEQELADYSAVVEMDGPPAEHKARALLNRGITYGQLNAVECALADFASVTAMNDAPEEVRADAYYSQGVVLWKAHAHRAAQESFESALATPGITSRSRTSALFALVEPMVDTSDCDNVATALTLAFKEGDRRSDSYGGAPRDLLTMVLRRGPAQWERYVTALAPLFIEYGVASKLGQGLTETIETLDSGDYSDSQLDLWNSVWQKLGEECDELELALRSLEAAVEAIKTRSDRPLFDLPLEIRELVRPLLKKSVST